MMNFCMLIIGLALGIIIVALVIVYQKLSDRISDLERDKGLQYYYRPNSYTCSTYEPYYKYEGKVETEDGGDAEDSERE